MDKRLIIGISGASGAPLAIQLLKKLQRDFPDIERHVVVSSGGEMTLRQECGMGMEQLDSLCHKLYHNHQIGAAIASGSFGSKGMVIVPCSMKTAAGIVSGYSENLLLRAADVCLKENRRLILVPRETPLSAIHLRNLYELSQMNTVILPPMLTYYHNPKTLQDCETHLVNRILSQLGLSHDGYVWEGMP